MSKYSGVGDNEKGGEDQIEDGRRVDRWKPHAESAGKRQGSSEDWCM